MFPIFGVAVVVSSKGPPELEKPLADQHLAGLVLSQFSCRCEKNMTCRSSSLVAIHLLLRNFLGLRRYTVESLKDGRVVWVLKAFAGLTNSCRET